MKKTTHRNYTFFQTWPLLPYSTADNTPRTAPEYSDIIALHSIVISVKEMKSQGNKMPKPKINTFLYTGYNF